MTIVRLIHWKVEEVPERLERLEKSGFAAYYHDLSKTKTNRNDRKTDRIKSAPPDVFVIDLARQPSHGKAVAYALREKKATRSIPIVFVDGDPAKVAKIREIFPDAAYTTWSRIQTALKRATSFPVKNPVVPKSDSGPHSSTPLPKKLGIKAGSVVALINPPREFEASLSPLPEKVSFRQNARGNFDLAVWFVESERQLAERIDSLVDSIGTGALWIAWPKKASGVSTDLSESVVRKLALAAGLVDYKVCAIDQIWSGLKFAKKNRTR